MRLELLTDEGLALFYAMQDARQSAALVVHLCPTHAFAEERIQNF
jgi:hypothetical protein